MNILFDHRVSSRLFKLGWSPAQLRQFGMVEFSNICSALKRRGYSVEAAVKLWDGVLAGDEHAKDQIRVMGGLDGLLALGPREDGDDLDGPPDGPGRDDVLTVVSSAGATIDATDQALAICTVSFVASRDELLKRLRDTAPPAAVALQCAIAGAAIVGWLAARGISLEGTRFAKKLEELWLIQGIGLFAGTMGPRQMDDARLIFREAVVRVESAIGELGSAEAPLRTLTGIRQQGDWVAKLFDDETTGPVLFITCLKLLSSIPEACGEAFG